MSTHPHASPLRPHDWDGRLLAWAARRLGAAFAWGETDCAMLCFEAVDTMRVGSFLADRYRGRWNDALSARRFSRDRATDLGRELVAAGAYPVAPNFQQRGDLLLVPAQHWMCGHVCLGERSLSSSPAQNVNYVSTAAVLAMPGVRILRA